MTNLYNIANDYFMAHQPAFMLGLFVIFFAVVPVACWASDHLASRKGGR